MNTSRAFKRCIKWSVEDAFIENWFKYWFIWVVSCSVKSPASPQKGFRLASAIRFYSLASTRNKLVDFATKYLRKNSPLRVEIYSFVLDVRDVIARLVKICFSISTIYNNLFRFVAFYFWWRRLQVQYCQLRQQQQQWK